MLKSADIHPLYPRCIARNDEGEYVDNEARMQLADVAGAQVGMQWVENAGRHHEGAWVQSKGFDGDALKARLMSFHGRLAPLVSLDAAASIPLPKDVKLRTLQGPHGCYVGLDMPDGDIPTFEYTDPRDRPAAECAARVYANLRAK
jgi:hypothetical protein